MSDTNHLVAGDGPLTYRRVLREALGMFRIGYARVAVVALILFVPPPLLIAALTGLLEDLESDPGLIPGLGFLLAVGVALTIRLFGPVVYAGYLEAAVGHEYFHDQRVRFPVVLRTLPWMRLVIADAILVVGTVVGLSLFVLPGLIWLTLFTLVGPIIVQERLPVIAAYRRTYQLSRKAWRMVFLLVVVLLGVEHAVEAVMHELVAEQALLAQVLAEWALAALIGAVVGLTEVSLATELMARTPRRTAVASGDQGDR